MQSGTGRRMRLMVDNFGSTSTTRCVLYSVVLFLMMMAGVVQGGGNQTHAIVNFVAVNQLADGEQETRIFYDGIYAKETAVSNRLRGGLRLRQLSDGRHFIQLIYDDEEALRDCEYVEARRDATRFIRTFKRELKTLIDGSPPQIQPLDGVEHHLPPTIRHWFNYTQLRDMCKERHLQITQTMRNASAHNNGGGDRNVPARNKRSPFVLPGTLWCGVSDASFHYTDLGKMAETDKCCRKHDYCKKNILPYETKYNYYNPGPFTVSHCFCDARFKRDLSDLLRVPGTKWCGKGYSATKFTQLGGFSRTDKCCRVHDTSCPFWIGGFESKYGLFNWRVNTLMHCRCDERFRACLKVADTSDSNLVGKIFFNIVQTKCFVLRPKKICTEFTWWGKCKRKKYIKQAILRNNPRFN